MPDVKFSNLYPYTDFHELNLDWVIKEVKFWSERVGKSIQKIELTGTVGLVDTYTITYSDGSTSTFDVTNGNGIASVAKTGTAGLIDTYTITFQDGSTTAFDVHNGTASIDPSLTLPDYAADAKNTGDGLRSVVDMYLTDVDSTSLMTRTCYTNNTGVGSTIDMTGVTETQFAAIVIPCKSGDQFVITGTGGNAYRLWCFTDGQYKILSVANTWATASSMTLTAAQNGYFFFEVSTAYTYKIIRKNVYAYDPKVVNPFTGFSMFQSIAGVGDSYTEGDMVTADNTWVTRSGINYLSVIGRRNGVTVKNYGSGGRTTKTYQESGAFSLALSDAASDLYIFALGQNDVNAAMTKGTIADIHVDYTQNPDTFYGNYGRVISQIMAHAPNARFIILGSWVQGISAYSGLDYQSYNDAIEEIADHYGFPYINPFDDEFFNSNLYNDNMSSGHPTAMSYAGMGIAIERLFNKCVIENASYFKYALID